MELKVKNGELEGFKIQMSSNREQGAPIDSMFRVDGIKATISNYNPVIDGVIKPWEIEPIRR